LTDTRGEALETRRKCLARLLSRSNKAMRQGIQLSEAITGDGAAIFRHACGLGLEGILFKRIGRSREKVRDGFTIRSPWRRIFNGGRALDICAALRD
jgi:hypothetical protein